MDIYRVCLDINGLVSDINEWEINGILYALYIYIYSVYIIYIIIVYYTN